MSKQNPLAILSSGKTLWDNWRREYANVQASEPDLHEAYLHNADLHRADLTEANLSEADLRGADLDRAILDKARFNETYLSKEDRSAAGISRDDGQTMTHPKPGE